MIDNTKLLIRESEPGEGIIVPAGAAFPEDFIVARAEDGRMGLYQSVRGIIWDCDKRPLDIVEENVNG